MESHLPLQCTAMDKYIADNCRNIPPHRLVLELEDITQNKLLNDAIIECRELREYYLKRQGFIISHLRTMMELG